VPGSPRLGRVWPVAVAVLAFAVAINLSTPAIATAVLKSAFGRSFHVGGGIQASVEAWPPPAPWWGTADVMSLAARDVHFGDLQLATFSATLDRVRFDPVALYLRHTLVIRSVGFGVAHAEVSQDALARTLALQPNIRVASVVLRPGRVFLRGSLSVLGAQVPVEAQGRLVLTDAAGVQFILDQATVAGGTLQVPRSGLVKSNITVPPMPFGLHLTSVIVGDGRLAFDAATGSP